MFAKAFGQRLIYIFEVDLPTHKGLLKIGDTTFKSDMQRDALNRIKKYSNTLGVAPQLLYTELAIKNNGEGFRDYDVHNVLKNSGIKPKYFEGTTAKEWFRVDLKTARAAIDAVKLGRKNLSGMKIEEKFTPIIFRPEQEEAISRTVEYFKSGGKGMQKCASAKPFAPLKSSSA